MRDSREPTPTNGEGESPRETLAESVPRVFAARLRAARRAAEVSQAVLADAMRYRGFNWRQTTVAKSEAGDRPVLFAEAIALSQIFKRGLEYFLFEGTEVDSVVDEAAREIDSLEAALAEAEVHVLALKNDLDLNRCTFSLGSAISKHQKTGDWPSLANEVLRAFSRWGPTCLDALDDLVEGVGIDPVEIVRLDHEVLVQIAKDEKEMTDKLSQEDLAYDSPERLIAISDFLEGKEVPEVFLAAMRDEDKWTSFMAGAVLGLFQKRLRKPTPE
jgi:transcriptional regulator with XRE-family HTH domain